MSVFIPVDPLPFPDQLSNYRLTIELLSQAFDSAQSGNKEELSTCWSLHGVPCVEFYRKLHGFLKKWEKTRSLTKIAIGRFYIAIDKLQERGSSSSNTFKFIERTVSSSLPDSSVMSYTNNSIADGALKSLQAEVQDYQEQVDQLASHVNKQQELSQMKSEVEKTKQELIGTKHALNDITNAQRIVENKRSCLQKKVKKVTKLYEDTLADLFEMEDDLFIKNSELLETISSLQKEVLKPTTI